jgi:hypothetical protein
MAWKIKIPATIEVEIPNADDEDSAKFQADELAYDTYGYGMQTPSEGKVIKFTYDMKNATVKPCEPTIG